MRPNFKILILALLSTWPLVGKAASPCDNNACIGKIVITGVGVGRIIDYFPESGKVDLTKELRPNKPSYNTFKYPLSEVAFETDRFRDLEKGLRVATCESTTSTSCYSGEVVYVFTDGRFAIQTASPSLETGHYDSAGFELKEETQSRRGERFMHTYVEGDLYLELQRLYSNGVADFSKVFDSSSSFTSKAFRLSEVRREVSQLNGVQKGNLAVYKGYSAARIVAVFEGGLVLWQSPTSKSDWADGAYFSNFTFRTADDPRLPSGTNAMTPSFFSGEILGYFGPRREHVILKGENGEHHVFANKGLYREVNSHPKYVKGRLYANQFYQVGIAEAFDETGRVRLNIGELANSPLSGGTELSEEVAALDDVRPGTELVDFGSRMMPAPVAHLFANGTAAFVENGRISYSAKLYGYSPDPIGSYAREDKLREDQDMVLASIVLLRFSHEVKSRQLDESTAEMLRKAKVMLFPRSSFEQVRAELIERARFSPVLDFSPGLRERVIRDLRDRVRW